MDSAASPGAGATNPPVCVISPDARHSTPTFIQGLAAGLPTAVTCLYCDGIGSFPRSTANGRPLLSESGFHRLSRAMGRRIRGRTHDYYAQRALEQFLVAAGTKAVLAQFGPTGAAVLETCERIGVPLIVQFRGYDAYRRSVLSRHADAYRRLFTQADAIVAASRAMQDHLATLGAPRDRLHYVPSGVDPEVFRGGEPASQPPHFVAVGRFVDKKAPFLTLLAFAKVAPDDPRARMTMVGDGPLLETCRRLASVFRIGNRITFPGKLSQQEVAERLRTSRAFVQHSVRASDGDAEGTPNSVMEASATGIPVIATRHMGISEAVVEGVTGLLVDEGDVEGMAEAMRAVARAPELAAEMGAAGRRHILAHFRRIDCLVKLMAIIRNAVAGDRLTVPPR